MDVMTHDMIVKLCTDFYDKESIENAKRLLYNSCIQEDLLPRYKQRKGPNKKSADVTDILACCHEMGSSLPQFVASDFSQLPPLSLDCIDLSSLLRDISSIKAEIQLLMQERQTNNDVLSELRKLRTSINTTNVSVVDDRLYATSDVTRDNGNGDVTQQNGNDVTRGSRSGVVTRDNSADNVIQCDNGNDNVTSDNGNDNVTSDNGNDDVMRDNRNHNRTPNSELRTSQHAEVSTAIEMASEIIRAAEEPRPNIVEATSTGTGLNFAAAVNSDPPAGFTVVSRRKQAPRRTEQPTLQRSDAKVVVGTGMESNLSTIKAAPRQTQSTSVFVSRLDASTSPRELTEHVLKSTNCRLKCIKLRTKYDSYASFRIFANDNQIDKLLVSNIWPKGAIVREFQ